MALCTYKLIGICRDLDQIFMLIGGAAVFSGLFCIVYAALCFHTGWTQFMNVLTDGARRIWQISIGIYGKRMLQFCTVIVPYALIQYYRFYICWEELLSLKHGDATGPMLLFF